MNASPLCGIIFDWHGVLDETTYRGFSNFMGLITGRPPDEIRAVVSPQERLYVAGRLLSPEAFWAFLQRTLQLNNEQLARARDHLLTVRLHQPLWEKIPSLARRFRLGILSDCPADKRAMIRAMMDLSAFAAVAFSCDYGYGKDTDAFFMDLCTRLGCQPAACLYVDDTGGHIATATRLGFRTHLFRSAADFARCLSGFP